MRYDDQAPPQPTNPASVGAPVKSAVEDAVEGKAEGGVEGGVEGGAETTPAPRRKALTLHTVGMGEHDLRAAPVTRPWMDDSRAKFAYRCLPLVIANTYGWEVLCPWSFSCIWNGTSEKDGITCIPDPGRPSPAEGHFGGPILTFQLPGLFSTEPGYDLLMQGPVNRPKDGIQGLTGIIETRWLPFTATMNWFITRAQHPIRFERGEPICHIFPIPSGEIEQFNPVIRPLANDTTMNAQCGAWAKSRAQFNAEIGVSGSPANLQKWQRFYHNGTDSEGTLIAPTDHRTKIRLAPFRTEPKEPGP